MIENSSSGYIDECRSYFGRKYDLDIIVIVHVIGKGETNPKTYLSVDSHCLDGGEADEWEYVR